MSYKMYDTQHRVVHTNSYEVSLCHELFILVFYAKLPVEKYKTKQTPNEAKVKIS